VFESREENRDLYVFILCDIVITGVFPWERNPHMIVPKIFTASQLILSPPEKGTYCFRLTRGVSI